MRKINKWVNRHWKLKLREKWKIKSKSTETIGKVVINQVGNRYNYH